VTALLACLAVGCGADGRAQVRPNEEVLFLPTFTWYEPAAPRDRFAVDIHAWVYQPIESSVKRRTVLAILRKALGLEEGEAATELFEARAKWFLVDSERGRTLSVRFGDQTHRLVAETDETGHLWSKLLGWEGREGDLAGEAQLDPGWVKFEAVMPEGDGRKFAGEVLHLPRRGLSVISDIDDTVKVSNVRDKKALVVNAFLKEYEPVAGMPALYRALAEKGAAFHYVSASPWQLYPPLRAFVDAKKYPRGTYHMRDFSLGHSEFFDLFKTPDQWKPTQIEPILAKLTTRRFVLIGDSGESDPEIYGKLARKYPDQIVGVFIRNITNEPGDAPRYEKAFKDVPRGKWKVFEDPAEVREKALSLIP